MFGSSDKTPLLPSTNIGRVTSSSHEDRNYLAVPVLTKSRSQSHHGQGGKDGLARRRSSQNMRTNSIAISHDLEDCNISTVSTSYGPVVVVENANPGYGGLIGLVLATISGVLFTVNNFLFQYFDLNLTDMFLARSGLQTAMLGIILLFTGCSNFLAKSPLDWFLVTAQSITSAARVGLTFACLELLPIGDALTIIFSEPLWTIVLSKIFLRTPVGLLKMVFSLFLITGVVLCTQPPVIFSSVIHDHRHHGHHDQQNNVQEELHYAEDSNATVTFVEDLKTSVNFTNETSMAADIAGSTPMTDDSNGYFIGVLLALGAAISGSASNVIVAMIAEMSSTSLCTYSGLGGIILALIYGTMLDTEDVILTNITMVSVDEWLILLMLGGMGLVGFFALTRSLQLIPPTTVAVVRAMEIVLAYGVQAAVLGEIPNTLALVGSSFVIISVVAFAAEDLFLSCWKSIFGTK